MARKFKHLLIKGCRRILEDSLMNLCGWIFTGVLVMVACLWFMLEAIQLGAFRIPNGLLLLSLNLVCLGHFALALQNYCARNLDKLDAQRAAETLADTMLPIRKPT